MKNILSFRSLLLCVLFLGFQGCSGSSLDSDQGDVDQNADQSVFSPSVTCLKPSSRCFSIGGTVTGLTSAQTIDLTNARSTITVAANGDFNFTQLYPSGTPYSVAISRQPTGTTCSVSNGSGVLRNAGVTNVLVNCTSVVAKAPWAATSLIDAPSPRGSTSSVWTGSQMIVWGGVATYFDGPLATGGMYNPTLNNWITMSTVGAPLPRGRHSAVWTGTKMIVWGGDSGFVTFYNDGGIYDPATNTWSPISLVGAPISRTLHTAVWTGSKMIVWGGDRPNGTRTNTGGIFDPSTNTWTAVSTVGAPTARNWHSAVWAGSKMIVWGGQENGVPVSNGGIYDPSTNSWSAMSSIGAPSPKPITLAVWTGSKMLIWGRDSANNADGGIYDPTTNQWTSMSTVNAPIPRYAASVGWTGSKMIVWGGTTQYFVSNTNTGALYDPVANTWTTTTLDGAPTPRFIHTAVVTPTQMIVWGGLESNYVGNTYKSTSTNTGGVFTYQP